VRVKPRTAPTDESANRWYKARFDERARGAEETLLSKGSGLKSILIAFALVGAVGAAHPRAATCQDLRAKLDRLEKVLALENDWLNPASPQADDFGSQQERRDIAAAKLSVRQYLQTAHAFLVHCPDPSGYIAQTAHIWEQVDRNW
jgi:hypothetical protein